MVASVACKDSITFSFWISFVEIYNEIAYDLLDPNFATIAARSAPGSLSGRVGPNAIRRIPLDLRTDKKGNVFVKGSHNLSYFSYNLHRYFKIDVFVLGLRWFVVSSPEEAYRLLMVGRRCQQVGATKLNQNSSRSHSIFSIKAMRTSNKDAARFVRVSSLTFCDLAGSERCQKAATLNQINRLREANNINTSLLALGK